MFECVINLSEGRDSATLRQLASASGSSLRDLHSDEFHHRSVFTLINEPAGLVVDVRALITAAYELLNLSGHAGVHPRFGVVDVVPFVALNPDEFDHAVQLRDELAPWLAENFHVPVFFYGPLSDGSVRTLPQVRHGAFTSLVPDAGPAQPSPRLGSVALGARPLLVAWNIWLSDVTIDVARTMAKAVRSEAVRSLAFQVGDEVQVSCNIVDVTHAKASEVYDRVLAMVPAGGAIDHAELVGLAPRAFVENEDPQRWAQLGLSAQATIEARSS